MSLLGSISDASVRETVLSDRGAWAPPAGRGAAPVENFSQDLRPDLVDGPMTVPMWCSHRLREESATRICRKIEPRRCAVPARTCPLPSHHGSVNRTWRRIAVPVLYLHRGFLSFPAD